MALKDIHDKVKDGQPVDANELKNALENMKKAIDDDVKDKQEQKDIINNPDKTDSLNHVGNSIDKTTDALPDSGETTPDQNYKVKSDVENMIKNLTGDPSINPETLTKDDLKKMGLDDKTIDEIMA
jgi:hypothetical protein